MNNLEMSSLKETNKFSEFEYIVLLCDENKKWKCATDLNANIVLLDSQEKIFRDFLIECYISNSNVM